MELIKEMCFQNSPRTKMWLFEYDDGHTDSITTYEDGKSDIRKMAEKAQRIRSGDSRAASDPDLIVPIPAFE